jgi:holo-[acyl-carrier protein] synthase
MASRERQFPEDNIDNGAKSMQIAGIGSEIVECLRIGRMIEQHGEQFLNRVYTPREIRYCQSRKHATAYFAGHWAAKEAVLRVLGLSGRGGLEWTDLEVRDEPDGTPKIMMCGAVKDRAQALRISDILLTIAHCRAYATATAIGLREEAEPEQEEKKQPEV